MYMRMADARDRALASSSVRVAKHICPHCVGSKKLKMTVLYVLSHFGDLNGRAEDDGDLFFF